MSPSAALVMPTPGLAPSAAGPKAGDYLIITPFDEDNTDDQDLPAASRS